MQNRFEKKLIIKFFATIFLAGIFFIAQGIKIPYIDTSSDTYFKSAIAKAGVAYASARGVNAIVSMMQNSQLNLEPAGVGVSLAVGQVLDPINDMTERVSDVLVLAITSLGLQKLLYEMSISIVPLLLGVVLVLFAFSIWFENEKIKIFHSFLLLFSLALIVARFALPVASFANQYLYENFFSERIQASTQALHVKGVDVSELSKITLPTKKETGFWGKISNGTKFIQDKSAKFKEAFVYTLHNAGNLIENLLNLTLLYVGVFLIQVIFLPLFIFWLFFKIFKLFF
jgi:hypothetical protein